MKLTKKNIFYIVSIILAVLAFVMVLLTSVRLGMGGDGSKDILLGHKDVFLGAGKYKVIGAFWPACGALLVFIGLILGIVSLVKSLTFSEGPKYVEIILNCLTIALLLIGGIMLFFTESSWLALNENTNSIVAAQSVAMNKTYLVGGVFAILAAVASGLTFVFKE